MYYRLSHLPQMLDEFYLKIRWMLRNKYKAEKVLKGKNIASSMSAHHINDIIISKNNHIFIYMLMDIGHEHKIT